MRKPAGTQKSAGFRKYEGDALWLPNTTRPEWLSGELPGDRGFDPLGLAKPVSYLQYDIDQNDQVRELETVLLLWMCGGECAGVSVV